MFAKIKDDRIIQFPYGYDELQADNPFTLFTGVIDIKEIFDRSEAAVLHGYELVEVEVEENPRVLEPIQKATLSQFPVKDGDKWMLKWDVEFVPPDDLEDA